MLDLGTFIATNWPSIAAVSAIVVFAPLEVLFPRLSGQQNWRRRLPPIIALAVLGLTLGFLLNVFAQTPFVRSVIGLQVFSIAKQPLPAWVIFIASLLLIDFLNYAFHRLSHVVPVLWRLHAVHHADEHVTAASGQLHHPLEVVAHYFVLLFCFVVLGVPVVVVGIYALVAGMHNAFAHADIALPVWLDRWLRYLIVTPDLHRTHHSIDMREGNSNFAQVFTIWDRLLGTYVDRPKLAAAELKMGLPGNAQPDGFRLMALMAYPFHRRKRS